MRVCVTAVRIRSTPTGRGLSTPPLTILGSVVSQGGRKVFLEPSSLDWAGLRGQASISGFLGVAFLGWSQQSSRASEEGARAPTRLGGSGSCRKERLLCDVLLLTPE